MKTPTKLAIVAALVVAAIGAVALKNKGGSSSRPTENSQPVAEEKNTAVPKAAPAAAAKLPKLVDLGAGKCIPCKLMKPILDDLKANYADRFITEFIDVWENPAEGKKYNIEMIPTQIFYNAEGRELFRHVGFYGKEEILAKWKELGVDVTAKASP